MVETLDKIPSLCGEPSAFSGWVERSRLFDDRKERESERDSRYIRVATATTIDAKQLKGKFVEMVLLQRNCKETLLVLPLLSTLIIVQVITITMDYYSHIFSMCQIVAVLHK